MDFEPNELIEKLKKNKLAIPAIVIGVGAGLFFLSRNKPNANNEIDFGGSPDEVTPEETSGSGEGGNGETIDSGGLSDVMEQIAGLQENQDSVLGNVAASLNDALSWVTGALEQQSQQTQSALDEYANQDYESPYDVGNDLIGQLFDFLPDLPIQLPPEASGFYDDYVSSDGASFQYGNQAQEQVRDIQKQATVKAKNVAAPIRNVTNVIRTIIPQTRGNLGPTYNSPNIQSSGGFGRSKSFAQTLVNRAKTIIPNTRGSIVRTFNSPNVRSRGGFGGNRSVPNIMQTTATSLRNRASQIRATVVKPAKRK